MNTQQKRIKHEQDYIEFLERRTKSANYKKNVSPEEYATTEAKLKKARLIMRVLKKWFAVSRLTMLKKETDIANLLSWRVGGKVFRVWM